MYDWSKHHRFIVYGLTDPRTDEIRYIGRSSAGPGRPLEHRLRISREKTHKAAWIRSLARDGVSYGVVVLKECSSKEETVEAEKQFILMHRLFGARLTNLTEGGEGTAAKKLSLPDSEIVDRYANGESELALARSYGVQRWTIRRRLIEGGAEIRGRSAANTVRMSKMSVDERKALAAAANAACRGKSRVGRPHSAETRAKMSASQTARLAR